MWYHIVKANEFEGKVYDIEIRRASEGADVHRARFHSSMIDARMLKKRQKFKELHDSYVIFITKEDARRMLENGKLSYEEIAEYTDLSVEEIKKLASLQWASD